MYEKAKKILLNKYKDSEVVSSYKIKDGYLFAIQPKGNKEKLLDPFFKVVNNEIKEWSPVMDPDEYGEALQNRIE